MILDLATRADRSLGDCFRARFVGCFAALFLCMASFLPFARGAEVPTEQTVSVSDQLAGEPPDSITGNPAAENELPGTGLAGRLLQLPEDTGLRLGGLWLVDTNGLLSGVLSPGNGAGIVRSSP